MSKRTLEQPEPRREVRSRRDISFLERLSPRVRDLVIPSMLCDESAMERRLMECEDLITQYTVHYHELKVRHDNEMKALYLIYDDLEHPNFISLLIRSDPAALRRIASIFNLDDVAEYPITVKWWADYHLFRFKRQFYYEYLDRIWIEYFNERVDVSEMICAVKKTQTELTKSQRDCRNDLKCFRAVLGQ
jgi:hypothetical protein